MEPSRVDRLQRLLPILACPTCRGPLEPMTDALRCSACSRNFPIVEGRPTFLPGLGERPRVMPADKISNALDDQFAVMFDTTRGWSLNLGAGGTAHAFDRCVEVEYAIFRHTDVAADAHALPFASEVFDNVVSFNTFEHLAEPHRAAAEIFRVLKPGGRVVIQTAFLQPLHESPHHYYNATEFGLRRWFADFPDAQVSVPRNFQPAYVLGWTINRILNAVSWTQGPEARDRYGAMTLGQWSEFWNQLGQRWNPEFEALADLPACAQSELAAGFELDATKPPAPAPAPAPPAPRAESEALAVKRPRAWDRLSDRLRTVSRRSA